MGTTSNRTSHNLVYMEKCGWRGGDGLGPSLTGTWTPLAVLRLPSGRGLGWDNTTTPDRHTGRPRPGPVTTIFQGGDVGSPPRSMEDKVDNLHTSHGDAWMLATHFPPHLDVARDDPAGSAECDMDIQDMTPAPPLYTAPAPVIANSNPVPLVDIPAHL